LKTIDENTFNLIFENISEGIFIVDENAMFIRCNEAFKQIVLYDRNEIKGKKFDDIFNIKTNFKSFISKIKNQKELVENIEFTNKNNNVKNIDLKIKFIEEGNKIIFFVNNTLQHIISANNELNINCKFLRESEAKYKNLFENIPLGIFTVKKDGVIESINSFMLKILGSSSIEKSLSLNVFDIPNLKGTKLLKDIKESLDYGKNLKNEYEYTSIWGKKVLVRAFISPIINNNEKIIVIIDDLTKDKLLQNKLDDRTEQLLTLINQTPDIIIFKDMSGRWLLANEIAIELFGLENVVFYKKTDLELIKNKPKLKSELENNINTDNLAWKKGSMLSFDEVFYTKSGQEKVFEVIKLPIYHDDGSKKTLLTIGRDITKRRKYEIELKSSKEKAEEADSLKSSFLANMSHEIRTPLNGIIGFSTLLKEYSLKKEDVNKFVDIIIANSNQLVAIIDDILFISKLQVKQVKVSKSEFSLNQLIKNLLNKFTSSLKLIPEKNITLKICINNNEDINILTDKSNLYLVYTKLLRNAIKFTNSGEIEFGYNIDVEKNIVFFVKDTGVGISKEKQHIIFKKFRQVDDSTIRPYGGTGIGLSIVKGVIDLLKGELWLESELNKGAKFSFTLPINSKDDVQIKKKKEKERSDWSCMKILIVDDVEESRILLEEILFPTKAKLYNAENGKKAIDVFIENQDIDLVLMDIQLPEINGFETAKRIKGINNNVKIIAQTAFANQGYEEKSKYSKFDDFINKPIVAPLLLEKISNLLYI